MFQYTRRHDGLERKCSSLAPPWATEWNNCWLSWLQNGTQNSLMYVRAVLTTDAIDACVSMMILKATCSATGSQCSDFHIYSIKCEYFGVMSMLCSRYFKLYCTIMQTGLQTKLKQRPWWAEGTLMTVFCVPGLKPTVFHIWHSQRDPTHQISQTF